MPFQITHDRASNHVTMRLAKPGFLQRLEVSFAMAPLDDGSTALTVSQKIKPSLPTWDPVSKHIVKVGDVCCCCGVLHHPLGFHTQARPCVCTHHAAPYSKTPYSTLPPPIQHHYPYRLSTRVCCLIRWPTQWGTWKSARASPPHPPAPSKCAPPAGAVALLMWAPTCRPIFRT